VLTLAAPSGDFEYTPDVSPSRRGEDDVTAKFRFNELGKPSRKRKRGGSPMAIDGFEIEGTHPGSPAPATVSAYTAQWLDQYAQNEGFIDE
jgi:hypothetical protein